MWVVIVLIFATCFWAAFAIIQRLLSPRLAAAERASFYTRPKAGPAPARGLSLRAAITRVWMRLDVGRSLDRLLDQAGVLLTPAEFWIVSVACAAAAAAIGLVIGRSPLVAAACAAGGLTAPLAWVRVRRHQRRRHFDQQLPDALMSMSAALRAGFGITQALQTVARDQPEPLSGEFERGLREMEFGRGLDELLESMVRRTQSRDLEIAVSGIMISRQVGGNLAELLDNVVVTLRERVRLRRMIRVLTAQQRLSAWIILAVPPVVMAILLVGLPDYTRVLWTTQAGQILLALSLGMQLIGMYVIRRIVSIEV